MSSLSGSRLDHDLLRKNATRISTFIEVGEVSYLCEEAPFDVFHLKGVVTTNGNRAYESLYGEQDVSSAAVQAAIDKGAIIVGKATTVDDDNKANDAMKFSEIDLTVIYGASGEKPVFESRTSLESDHSDVAKNMTRNSTVIELGEVSYLCEEAPFHPLKLSESSAIRQLVSFIPPEGPISCQSLQKVIQQDLQDDDVLSSSFLGSIVLVTQETSLDRETLGLLSSFGCKRLFLTNTNIGKGPFFFSCKGIFRVFRLYPDTHDAFVTSVIPSLADKNT
ncbi:hypothetical protein B0T16DRAFT_512393 [Cercophora newfieldiana]|uniref:Scytalone dehydratase-like protein Arp1 N-terminal domain-containing protein n=1 Tax=Cercophora newfieldiana TaxID=92897 RepID=A0AA39Y289_9PEZI|nr:hypothetical protein B0T16DRAFT_512393 [Cercophora newfieldiana]